MGLSLGHLSALRVPRRGSLFISYPYPGLREPDGSLTPRYYLPPLERGFRVRRAHPPSRFKSAGRQTIAGAEAASAAKSPVAGEKHIGAPPDGGPTEGHRMGLGHGHLSAARGGKPTETAPRQSAAAFLRSNQCDILPPAAYCRTTFNISATDETSLSIDK